MIIIIQHLMKEIVFGNWIRLAVYEYTFYSMVYFVHSVQREYWIKNNPNYSVKSDTVIILSKTTYRTRCFHILIKMRTNINMDELFQCFIIISMSVCCCVFSFFCSALLCLRLLVLYIFTMHSPKKKNGKLKFIHTIFSCSVSNSFSPLPLASCRW